jgi:hypothetical protein
MNISLKQASDVLGTTQDELMYLVQSNRIEAGVDQDTLAWEFNLNEILELKDILKEEAQQNLQDGDTEGE